MSSTFMSELWQRKKAKEVEATAETYSELLNTYKKNKLPEEVKVKSMLFALAVSIRERDSLLRILQTAEKKTKGVLSRISSAKEETLRILKEEKPQEIHLNESKGSSSSKQ